jgi:hypothetical protein
MKRKENFLETNIGDINLLVPLGSQVLDMNGLITINETASYIWKLIPKTISVEELACEVVKEFDVDFEQAFTDLQIFIKEIVNIGLVEL